jgi:hypothetical protein
MGVEAAFALDRADTLVVRAQCGYQGRARLMDIE